MHWVSSFDTATSSRICLTLLHSLWQVAFFLIIGEAVTRLLSQASARKHYAILSFALVASLSAVPVTYQALSDESRPAASVASPTPMNLTEDAVDRGSDTAVATVAPVERRAGLSVIGAHVASPDTIGWLTLAPWLVGIYVVGVGIMLARLSIGLFRDGQSRRELRVVSSGPAHEAFRRLCERWDVRRQPLLAQTDSIVVPKLLGIFRPVIVLPSAALSGLTTKEIEMVLAHELSHLRRGDLWVNLLQRVAEAVLFFNPAIWVLSRRISRLREYCCDDAACDATACQPVTYAGLLVRLAESATRGRPDREWIALAATGSRPSELRRRVARLVGEPVGRPLRLTPRGVAFVAGVLCTFTFCPLLWPPHGQADEPSSTELETVEPTGSMTRWFDSGVGVELLGIGNHRIDEPQWWDGDGNRLREPEFMASDTSTVSVSPPPALTRSVAIRILNRPQSAYVTWRLNARGLSGYGSQRLKWSGVKPKGDIKARYFKVTDPETKTFDIPVGIAVGPWTPVGSSAKGNGAAMGRNGHSLVFSRGFETNGAASVIVSHDYFDEDIRIVAYDERGNLHPQQGRGGSSAGKIYQCQASFPGLPLDQVDRFEFQTRPYEWIEFEDLPLNAK